MRIGIIYDGVALRHWQLEAIRQIQAKHELYLMVAHGERAPRRKLPRHAAYYAMNVVSMRSGMTKRLPFPAQEFAISGRVDFTVQYDGAWASLPEEAVAFAGEHELDAILKFSLNLLRIPSEDCLATPILSYHHGDPREYRGRPAGFYETVDNRQYVGQIVQILCNRLDAGEILATGQTPVLPWSYRKTLAGAYRLSPFLLPKALDALERGSRVQWSPEGKNYRLPSNGLVARFAANRAIETVKRGLYGAFKEKRWQVSIADLHGSDIATIASDPSLLENYRANWETIPIPDGYTFLADPFFTNDGSILVEALSAKTGIGHLLGLPRGATAQGEGGSGPTRLYPDAKGHLSFPSTFIYDDREWILPESAHWSPVHIRQLSQLQVGTRHDIDIDSQHLLDPIMFERDGHWYLFANRADEGPDILRLWCADTPFARFVEHPQSPVRATIRGSRMGGAIVREQSRIFRIGQDRKAAYGDGICIFEILELTPKAYAERDFAQLSFEKCSGPHTLNVHGSRIVFDWYENRVSPLAGIRRLAAKLQSRR